MALYFECRINKNALIHTVFFGDFAHWEHYNVTFLEVYNDFRIR